jgi:hypothetical protein
MAKIRKPQLSFSPLTYIYTKERGKKIEILAKKTQVPKNFRGRVKLIPENLGIRAK